MKEKNEKVKLAKINGLIWQSGTYQFRIFAKQSWDYEYIRDFGAFALRFEMGGIAFVDFRDCKCGTIYFFREVLEER
jgi:hypothetical protein